MKHFLLKPTFAFVIAVNFIVALPAQGASGDVERACAGRLAQASHPQQEMRLRDNDFATSRGLVAYTKLLTRYANVKFSKLLGDLPAGSTWVDFGAGQALALTEALKQFPNLSHGIGIAYKKPETYLNPTLADPSLIGRFDYIDGAFVEDMSKQRKLAHLKGQALIASDLFGPLSYTDDLSSVLQAELDTLAVGGQHLIFMSDSKTQIKRERANGVAPEDLSIVDWLRTIHGIEVNVAPTYIKSLTGEVTKLSNVAIHIRKIAPDVAVPHNLQNTLYKDGAPPVRVFDWPLPELLNPKPAKTTFWPDFIKPKAKLKQK